METPTSRFGEDELAAEFVSRSLPIGAGVRSYWVGATRVPSVCSAYSESGPEPLMRQMIFSGTRVCIGVAIRAKREPDGGSTVPIGSGPKLPGTRGDSGLHPAAPRCTPIMEARWVCLAMSAVPGERPVAPV